MKKITLLLLAFTTLLFTTSSKAQAPCPINANLELGNLNNWIFYTGTCCPISTPTLVTTPGAHFTLTSPGPGSLDPCGGFSTIGDGVYSMKIGDNSGTSGAQKAVYNIHVPAGVSSYPITYRYAYVLEDPGHSPSQQPRMTIQAIDSTTGTVLPCANMNFVAGALPGARLSSTCTAVPTYYIPWTTGYIDLGAYSGHTIRMEFATSDCSLGGHFGYGYVDMTCGGYGITNSAPGCTVTLTAPSGFSSYAWYDSVTFTTSYSTTVTATVPTPSVPTVYAVILTPYPGFGCVDTLYTTVYPSTCTGTPVAGAVSASGSVACAADTVTFTDTGYSATGLQWQSSADSITWSNITGATNAVYAATGIAATTYFRCKDSCCVSGLTTATAGVKITYAPCCSGLPSIGAVTASTTYCSSCSLTLNLTGFAYLGSMTTQWQSSPDSITWTDMTGAAMVPYTFTPTGAYYYRCIVTCHTSGMSDTSAGIKVLFSYHIIADSVSNAFGSSCPGPLFYVKVNGTSSLLRLKTYYGDGTTDSIPVTPSGTFSYTSNNHNYIATGTYTAKQILYWNNIPQDSIRATVAAPQCRSLCIAMYYDNNSDCLKDAGESFNATPVNIEVDSSGVIIDTVSATSGIYYKAYGPDGTVYAFRLLPSGFFASCPISGILYDTIQSANGNYPTKYFGLNCLSSSAFDLALNTTVSTGRHAQYGDIYVRNSFCAPVVATVTMNYSQKYGYVSTTPTATAYSASTITWSSVLLAPDTVADLSYHIERPTPWLVPGDTVQSYFSVTPTSGDVNTANNIEIRIDTVKLSFDPNEMSVTPSDCFLNDTQLQYTIQFENTGNDTAHNIYVMDTLSGNVDMKSLKIVMASATMNTALYNDGAYNIAKFDFPGINLRDSSHHGQCDGAVIYTIKTKPGLANGSAVYNRAGIYFDDNDVVMTNSVENIKGCAPESIAVTNNTHKVDIYPNPATDELTIKTDDGAYNSFTITNNVGQVLIQQQLNNPITKVNVKTLPAGLYYVTVKGDNGSNGSAGLPMTKKFVKM